MKTRHDFTIRGLALLIGAALLVALAFGPGCSDSDPGVTGDARLDGQSGDGPHDGKVTDGPVYDVKPGDGPSIDVKAGDGPASDVRSSDGPAADGPAADGPAVDTATADGPVGDAVTAKCSSSGDSCKNRKCCKGLRCCSGVPIPIGQARCYVTCPISDRNLKRDFQSVDPDDVLRRVMSLPITRWSYKRDQPSVRHIGPMAQDFKRTFGVGSSDRFIAPLDGAGVSLAAIKALTRAVRRLEAAQKAARARNAKLEAELRALRRGVCKARR